MYEVLLAHYLEQAGASLLLLEAIPQQLPERITWRLCIPVIAHVVCVRNIASADRRQQARMDVASETASRDGR